jgi:uncharacterized protein (TIGR00369 family)
MHRFAGQATDEYDPAMDPTYGIALSHPIATWTGREVLQAIVDGRLPQAFISRTLTFRLAEVGDGTVAFLGEPGQHLLNPMGSVHGGWALTLLDSACGAAGYSTLPPGVGYTTVETKGNLVRPILPETGTVRAEGRVLARGRQILTCEADVRAADGKLLAHGTSTLLVVG